VDGALRKVTLVDGKVASACERKDVKYVHVEAIHVSHTPHDLSLVLLLPLCALKGVPGTQCIEDCLD
jgi:hypothetical protein